MRIPESELEREHLRIMLQEGSPCEPRQDHTVGVEMTNNNIKGVDMTIQTARFVMSTEVLGEHNALVERMVDDDPGYGGIVTADVLRSMLDVFIDRCGSNEDFEVFGKICKKLERFKAENPSVLVKPTA